PGNFDQIIGMSQSLDDHERARRRVFLVLLLSHLVVTLAVLAVHNVCRGHYEVIDAPARGVQHCFEIGVNLLGLRFDIAFTDHVAGLIRSGLSSDEQELAALVENSLVLARPRVVQRLRLDDLSCHGYASWVKLLEYGSTGVLVSLPSQYSITSSLQSFIWLDTVSPSR